MYKNIIYLVLLFTILIFLSKKKENFSQNLDRLSTIAIKNFGNLSKIQTLGTNHNVDITGNINVGENFIIDGSITVEGGGDFTASAGSNNRYYFQDHEKVGRIRIGSLDNIPGIYAEDTDTKLNIKSSNNLFGHVPKVIINDNVIFKSNNQLQINKINNKSIKDYVQNKDWIYFMGGTTGSITGFHHNNRTGLLYFDAKNFQVSRDANWDNNKSRSKHYLTDRYFSTCR